MTSLAHNLLAWMLQTVVFASVAALLPILFRVRHPKTQLYYCHAALAFCLILPAIEPLRLASKEPASAFTAAGHWQWLWIVLAAGVLVQLLWMSGGLLRIRRYRIGATPLYPVPDAMRAASAITHADALFCVSEDAAGPVMMGWLAPVVLLPPAFFDLDEEAQCGIACHELLHVRRGDWMVTLVEELAGAFLWFNPGVWLLLSEARLAREQLVDAESVRLTALREPYIDALMSMARAHTWSDLVPAPSFLRRSHLTQRMQSLLSDTPASAPRVIASYGSILLILGLSAWAACAAFPMVSQPRAEIVHLAPTHQPAATPPPPVLTASNAPPASPRREQPSEPATLPPITDPHELVGPGVEVLSGPMERSSAQSLLGRARQRSLRHVPGTPPYRFTAQFQAAGNALETGPGELTETWFTGQKWRWTASLGGVSHTRLHVDGQLLEDRHVAVIPMRAHMLRNEVLWGTADFRHANIRSAKVQWQGRDVTCLLASEAGETNTAGRSWDDEEYCLDDATATLVVHSVAPGTYAFFDYGDIHFHGYALPNRVRIYVNGALAVDGTFTIADATAADAESLTPQAGMTATPPPVGVFAPFYTRTDAGSGNAAQPVVVHAEIDGEGKVVESELSAGDAGLFQAALEQIRSMKFGQTGAERQGYIDVRF